MPTCGQCQYGIMEKDVQARVCHGGPPTPLLTPKGVIGARPIVRVRDLACCLFKQKGDKPTYDLADQIEKFGADSLLPDFKP